MLPEGKMPLASALAGSFSRPACDSLYGCDAAFFSWSPALARGCDDDSHAARPSLAIMGGEPFVCNSDRQSESKPNVDILTVSCLFLQALRLLIVNHNEGTRLGVSAVPTFFCQRSTFFEYSR